MARGDFSSKAVFKSRDELGGLTRSFAEMTTQLADARELVHKSVVQVEGARANLQTILDNLTAGVIVFDRNGAIDTVNPGATRILKLPLSAYKGRRLDEVAGLGGFAQAVWQRFELHAESPEAGERDHWQDSFDLQFTTTAFLVGTAGLMLLANGSRRTHRDWPLQVTAGLVLGGWPGGSTPAGQVPISGGSLDAASTVPSANFHASRSLNSICASPGNAMKRSACAPSHQYGALTEYGISPG